MKRKEEASFPNGVSDSNFSAPAAQAPGLCLTAEVAPRRVTELVPNFWVGPASQLVFAKVKKKKAGCLSPGLQAPRAFSEATC